VRDVNENGLVDNRDTRVDELVGFEPVRALRGGLIDVRG
jgi:hypothetical protein